MTGLSSVSSLNSLNPHAAEFTPTVRIGDGVQLVHDETRRGFVYDDQEALVCRSFDFPEKRIGGESAEDLDVALYAFYPLHEGTVVRMFWNPAKATDEFMPNWDFATHKNLIKGNMGKACSFGTRSFWTAIRLALQAEPIDCEKLDKRSTYIFLLQDSENKIVNAAITGIPKLLHIATVSMDTCKRQLNPQFIGLQQPSQITEIKTSKDIAKYVEAYSPYEACGLVAVPLNGDLQTINIYNTEYNKLTRVRNNSPFIVQRAVELLTTGQMQDFVEMQRIFHEYSDILQGNLIARLQGIAHYLFALYKLRHIQKQRINVQKPVHKFFERMVQEYYSAAPQARIQMNPTYFAERLQTIPPYELRKIIGFVESNTVIFEEQQ